MNAGGLGVGVGGRPIWLQKDSGGVLVIESVCTSSEVVDSESALVIRLPRTHSNAGNTGKSEWYWCPSLSREAVLQMSPLGETE